MKFVKYKSLYTGETDFLVGKRYSLNFLKFVNYKII